MYPRRISAIIGTVVSVGDVVARCIKKLNDLRVSYHNAPLTLSTVIGQFYITKAALDQLSAWENKVSSNYPTHLLLALRMNTTLDSFSPLLSALEQRLDQYHNEPNSTLKSTLNSRTGAQFVWNETEIIHFSLLLDRQINAINLLIKAVQCQSLSHQYKVICSENGREVLQLARDCNSSLAGLDGVASIFTGKSNKPSIEFDFDAQILSSEVYQSAQLSQFKKAISQGKERLDSDANCERQASIHDSPSPKSSISPSGKLSYHTSSHRSARDSTDLLADEDNEFILSDEVLSMLDLEFQSPVFETDTFLIGVQFHSSDMFNNGASECWSFDDGVDDSVLIKRIYDLSSVINLWTDTEDDLPIVTEPFGAHRATLLDLQYSFNLWSLHNFNASWLELARFISLSQAEIGYIVLTIGYVNLSILIREHWFHDESGRWVSSMTSTFPSKSAQTQEICQQLYDLDMKVNHRESSWVSPSSSTSGSRSVDSMC